MSEIMLKQLREIEDDKSPRAEELKAQYLRDEITAYEMVKLYKAPAPEPDCTCGSNGGTWLDPCPKHDAPEADSTSETPRTDALMIRLSWGGNVTVGEFRQLERDLAQAIKERDKWKNSAMEQSTSLHREIANGIDARQQLAKAIKERDEARAEIKHMHSADAWIAGDYLIKIQETEKQLATAKEALEWIGNRYDDNKPTHQVAMDAYEMSCTAKQALAKINENRGSEAAEG